MKNDNTNPAQLVRGLNKLGTSFNIQACLSLLRQQANKLQQQRSIPGFAKGGMSKIGSLMDVPLMQSVPSLNSSTIRKLRVSYANGGFVDNDLHQILYLISVLEGGHLNPLEQQLLLELYEDLRQLEGGSK